MKRTLECTREADGRWLAQVPQIDGVLTHGDSELRAMAKAQTLALRVLAERIEDGTDATADMSFSMAEVQEAIDDDAPTVPTEEAMRQVRAAVFGK